MGSGSAEPSRAQVHDTFAKTAFVSEGRLEL